MHTLSIADAHQTLYDLEEKHDLLQYRAGNWSIWPALRWEFFNSLTSQKVIQEKTSWPIVNMVQIALEDILAYLTLHQAKYLILTKDLNLREKYGEYYKDVFFDDLLLRMNDFVKVDTLQNAAFFTARKNALIKSQCSLTLFRKLPSLFSARVASTEIKKTAQALSKILAPYTQVARYSPRALQHFILNFETSRQLFGWFLDRVQPSFLFILNAHGYPSIIAAAKERNIKVLEFQHGIIYKYHPGYSWNSYARPYKGSMPIPDTIFLYGAFWKDVLEEIGFWSNELQVVGSPRLDHYRSFSTTASSTVRLAVTTQPLVPPKMYCDYFRKFLQLAAGHIEVEITIKLHQRETNKEAYKAGFPDPDRVKVVLNNEPPSTLELLKLRIFT